MQAPGNRRAGGDPRRFEVLVPRWLRMGLLADLESRCAAIGVGCETSTRGQGSARQKAVILTVPAEVDEHAFAKLSSWIYVRVGTRPHDLSERTSTDAESGGAFDVMRVKNTWTSRDYELIVGRLIQAEFLNGVGAVCAATGARWEARVKRSGVARTIVVTISGPRHVVDRTEIELLNWQKGFSAAT
jgi:hypothetical protein